MLALELCFGGELGAWSLVFESGPEELGACMLVFKPCFGGELVLEPGLEELGA